MSEVKDKLVTVESLKYVNDSLEEKIKDLSNLRVDITGDEGWYEFANIPCGAGECCGTTVCLEQSHGGYQYAAIVEMSVYNNPSVNDIQVLFRQISGMNITAKLIYVVDADAGVARFYVWKYASEHIYIYSLTGFELDNGITWIADSAAITSTIENHVFAYYEAGLSEKIKDSDTDSTYMTIHYAGAGMGLENADWVAAWNPDDPTQIKAIAPSKLLKNSLLDFLHPIGSIYTSVVDTDPTALFGGTWERIKDTFLLTAGDTYAAGTTGGEAEHTLILDEMPYHYHAEFFYAEGVGELTVPGGTARIPGETGFLFSTSETPNASRGVLGDTSGVGGDQPHNNMPPYLTVYAWKRIA